MLKINNQKDWIHKYKNRAFTTLIKIICNENNMTSENIVYIYCDENALFKVGEKLIKIYNPLVMSKEKQMAEIEGYKRANILNLPSPKLLSVGKINIDNNIFYYMIMDYIKGKSLKYAKVSTEQMTELSFIIKDFLLKYNQKPSLSDLEYLRTDCEQFKHELISPELSKDIKNFYRELDLSDKYYVHADLHKGNIILDEKNHFHIIDFGDAKIAPKCCELPPIICYLYHFDKRLIKNTFDYSKEQLENLLLKGFVLNDFGTDYMQDMCDYLNYGNINRIQSIEELKKLITQAFNNEKIYNKNDMKLL